MSPRAARRGYRNPTRAGVLFVIALSALIYYGFAKDNPFARPFHLSVVVQDAAGVKKGSAVRIAGVDVGKVRGVERYNGAKAALVNLDINANGLPVYEGATVRIRPRLFLEGNFVLDMSPGTPGSRKLEDGDTIPLTQSSRSPQLDEILSTLQEPERKDLQVVFQQLGKALTEANPNDTNALTKGESAGESFNDTIKAGAAAGQDIEKLVRALQGQNRGDLAAALQSFAELTGPLADNADELGQLIDGLDRTVSVFAENSAAVRATVQELPPTLRVAEETLPQIRASLGPIRAVSRNITAGLDRVPGLVDASGPFLTQSKELLSDDEAGALVESLEPITEGLAESAPHLANLLSDLDRVSVCATDVLVPTANQQIQDGKYTTGLTSWDEFLRGTVGLASSSQSFDGNGLFARAAAAQGNAFVGSERRRAGTQPFLGVSNAAPTSTRPAFPADTKMSPEGAPWSFQEPCTKKSLPNLSAVPTGPADGSRPGR
ncbi:MAG: MCE family protein [Solirubrobacteraceae bacterium]|nr:MCE family protein [Solirubrobacteraceae bacterium]